MEWQAVVLAVQILLLAAGWLLFQRARGELSARAVETPVLGEVSALQKNIKQLLSELEKTGDRQSDRLEMACSEARTVLSQFDAMLLEAEERIGLFEQRLEESAASSFRLEGALARRDREWSGLRLAAEEPGGAKIGEVRSLAASNHLRANYNQPGETRGHREAVFSLADAGESPAAIARMTQLSEGEVETLLGLRMQRS